MFLLVACSSSIPFGTEVDPGDSADPPDTEIEAAPGDTSAASDSGGDTGEDPDDDTKVDIFDTSFIHTVEFTVSEEGIASLAVWPSPYALSTMLFDGEEMPDVGIRVKGRYGSYRTLPSKAGLKVDLREFGSDQDLHGIEKFNLNNMVQDCAKVHEYAAYGLHRLMGLPAARVAYARVFINGDDYGLYSLVEEYDDEFLKDNFVDPTGNLYDGDYFLYPDWSSYILVDFTAESQDLFVLDSGTDVGLADVYALTAGAAIQGPFADTVGSMVDQEQHAAFMAVAAWSGHSDSYSYYSNNYRVYFDPGRDGRAVFLPWDPDWAFYSSTNVTRAYGTVSRHCYGDPETRDIIYSYVDRLSAEVPGGEFQVEVEGMIDLIRDSLATDPKLESGMADIESCQQDLVDWFGRRGGELESLGF